jgi:hypothetical protein
MTTTYQAQEQILRDLVLVVNQLVRRQEQQGVRLPDEIGEAMKRLQASLLSASELSARRLEELKMQRSRLVARRGGLEELRRDQEWLLKNPKDQPPKLLLLTKENAARSAAAHAACLKELAGVEAEIAASTTASKTVRVKEFLR